MLAAGCACLPRRSRCPTERSSSDDRAAPTSTRDADRGRSIVARPARRHPRRCPSTCATRCGGWSRPDLEPRDAPGGLIVAGMGGSAIGGALARGRARRPRLAPDLLSRGYALPPWTTPDTTVLCASYSGDTEETLACFEAAGALGARRIVATTGGTLAEPARAEGVPGDPDARRASSRAPPSRYMTVPRSRSRRCAAPAPRCTPRSTSPPPTPRQLVAEWGPDGRRGLRSPRQLARALHGTIPQIAGAGLTAPIAYRWKTQINENAKLPAFAGELPGARPQRDRRLGRRRRARALQRRLPRRLRPAPARRASGSS